MKSLCFFIFLAWTGARCGIDSASAQNLAKVQAVSRSSPDAIYVRTANGDSFASQLSADGRFLVFISRASNLTAKDNNGTISDVFVRDLDAKSTTVVSLNAQGTGTGNGDSAFPSVSGNGRLIVFQSTASDLVSNDTNGVSDIFLRDLTAGTTKLVSVDHASQLAASGASFNPTITPNGQFIVFESLATNLVSGVLDANDQSDVFVHDLLRGKTILASQHFSASRTANGTSRSPEITPDGRRVAFFSTATNLVENFSVAPFPGIYVRDLELGTNLWVSSGVVRFRELVGTNANLYSYSGRISDDGRFVAFKMGTIATSPFIVLRHDLLTGTTDLAGTNAVGNRIEISDGSGPVISADGKVIAFEGRTNWQSSGAINLALGTLIYFWDEQTRQSRSASVNFQGSAAADGESTSPVLSADGRFLAFLSSASDLVTDSVNGSSQIFVRDLQSNKTKLITARPDGTATRDADEALPVLSRDGQRVAFQSMAGDLVPGDGNNAYDVFVRDLPSDLTELVSERAASLDSLTPMGSSSISPNAVSADGRFVVFVSEAQNLVHNDRNQVGDVFVRDLALGSNILVSVNIQGTGAGNGLSREPVISANGRVVAFVSGATDLANGDTNTFDDVFVRDLQSGTTFLASINRFGTASGSRESDKPSISADGQLIAFRSRANDLISDDTNLQPDVFVYDLSRKTNTLISVNAAGTRPAAGASEIPMITPDGRWVLFQSNGTDLEATPGSFFQNHLFARDLVNKSTVRLNPRDQFFPIRAASSVSVSSDSRLVAYIAGTLPNLRVHDLNLNSDVLIRDRCSLPSFGANSRFVAYQHRPSPNFRNDVWVTDLLLSTNFPVSVDRDGNADGNGDLTPPAISADGRFVIFKSRSEDLVSNDTNTWSDIFVRDVVAGTTQLVSLHQSGSGSGRSLSSAPVMGADGRTVVFQSFASDLIPGDLNNARDVFLLRLGSGDSDNDGLPDDWEAAHFGNLSKNGAEDADGDGLDNRAEYQAGTSPINNTSVLRVLTLTALSTGVKTILWSAIPGKQYQVQYKDNLSQPAWTDLPAAPAAIGTQGSATDTGAGAVPHRFYRVIIVP
jgi:Tol biopolymer transport system component